MSQLMGRFNEDSEHPRELEILQDPEPDSHQLCIAQARRENPEARLHVAEMYKRARWERFWERESGFDSGLRAAAAVAVDRALKRRRLVV
jgi:hypothetical protein